MALALSPKASWVFIGDSITDCGRRSCPESMGSGYVRLVRDYLLARDPAAAPVVVNAGISGNKITDLQGRWDNDVLAHTPDLVSVKIGINDVWHGIPDRSKGIGVDDFRAGYVDVLERLRAACPKAVLVLCEPSVIWPPAPEEGNALLQPYLAVVRELAQQFHATALVPLHGVFESAKSTRPDVIWAPDGVHPSSAGHMLIARTWLAALGLL